MTSARSRALGAVRVGDVIYGISGAGNEKLLLVYDISENGIFARHITTQTSAEFDRASGETVAIPTGGSCRIASTAVLSEDQYQVALGLDRKMRDGKGKGAFKLSEAEIQLLTGYRAFFAAHPLPDN